MEKCLIGIALASALAGCSSSMSTPSGPSPADQGDAGAGGQASGATARDPASTAVIAVDRFSDAAAHLFKRSANAMLPAANAPIALDQGPFITHGLGPAGEKVAYYNFDVQPAAPAPIYVLFAQGATAPIAGQLNIVDVLPGDPGYSDFWKVTKVTVPAGYVANSVTSLAEITAAGFSQEPTSMLVNCPVVPDGSTAALRYSSTEPAALSSGWYRDEVVKYFSFSEHALVTDGSGMAPVAQIFVTFTVNPDPSNPMSGPPSGFMSEPSSMQTHNVIDTLPADPTYSPLWRVTVYDDKSFSTVSNLVTARAAPVLAPNAGLVNCPVVSKQ
jgi:hypothetical protein